VLERQGDDRGRVLLGMTSSDDLPHAAATTAVLPPTDATKPPPRHRVTDVDARSTVHTRRRATVDHSAATGWRQRRRSVFDDAVDDTVGAVALIGTQLADRAAVAGLTAARERVQFVHTDAVVETWSTQPPTVVDVDVAATSRVADCADAPETIALVHAPTCHVTANTASDNKSLTPSRGFR